MRFLVTSLIRLSIVRINYLMFPLMNRPRWDPPNLLRGPQNPLWSPLTTSAVLTEIYMNLPYFFEAITIPSEAFPHSHCFIQFEPSLTLTIWYDPLPYSSDWWANGWTSTAQQAYQAHAAMSKLDQPIVFRKKTVHFLAFKKKPVYQQPDRRTDHPAYWWMDTSSYRMHLKLIVMVCNGMGWLTVWGISIG